MMLNSKSIGSKITIARKKMNLSQAELAQKISISSQAVGKWERGESMPDIITLNRLAEIFGKDLNYFSNTSDNLNKVYEEKKTEVGIIHSLKDNFGLNWNLSSNKYIDANFSGIKNLNDKLNGSSFKKCKLIESDLSNIYFKGNSIIECDFSNADLTKSKFYGSEIKDCLFANVTMKGSVINASEIRNCDFSNAKLTEIEVSTSEFRKNIIENTNWKRASFSETQFTDIIFSGILEDCSFINCAFSKVIFKNAIIKNSFFKFNDLKRVEFEECFVDSLTYEFLKNCKANMTGISIIDNI